MIFEVVIQMNNENYCYPFRRAEHVLIRDLSDLGLVK
jgi:hypothetical protein